MPERLMHFSKEVITEVHDRFNEPGHLKPRGFWISVEGDDNYGWSDWSRDNDFEIERLQNAHEITLTANSKVLLINSTERLEKFDEQWRIEPDWADPIIRKFGGKFDSKIDWAAVATRWQGIIIAPYMWSHRLDGPFWYYGWDCASGCIWDASAIASIKLVSEAVIDA